VEEPIMGSIAPEKILRELSDLWVNLSKETHGDAADGALRACSMTLVALTEESDDVAELGETIAALMPQYPARAIVVRLHGAGGENAERTLSERVSAQCWMPFGQHRKVCCEQVEIIATDAALADVPSVVLPLAVADLPLILWCRSARILAMPEFRALAAMAHRTIIDSAALPDARATLERMAERSAQGVLLGDFSWTRLTRWREILSQIFENREYLAKLKSIAKVTVHAKGESQTAAWYLGAWVVDALGSAGVHPEFYMQQEGEGREGQPPKLESILLSGDDFSAEVARRGSRLIVTVGGLAYCNRLPASTEYSLMKEELRIVGHDAIFEKTLLSAKRLSGGAQ
jgi:glucose-6-phosphate dehydrogenase assembly protein OpcA